MHSIESLKLGSISGTAKAIHRRTQTKWVLLLALPLLYLLTLYLYPISRILLMSLFDPEFTMKHYMHFFKEAVYFRILGACRITTCLAQLPIDT